MHLVGVTQNNVVYAEVMKFWKHHSQIYCSGYKDLMVMFK